VLLGALLTARRYRPDDLNVRELLARLEASAPATVILATTERGRRSDGALSAEAAAPLGVRITRIARACLGGDLEYADPGDLSKALEGRREIS